MKTTLIVSLIVFKAVVLLGWVVFCFKVGRSLARVKYASQHEPTATHPGGKARAHPEEEAEDGL
jgi:hypothetical protein